MEKIKLSKISVIDLIHLESAVRLLYTQSENEYIAFRGQLSPSGLREYADSLSEMEEKVRKYGTIRRRIVEELGIRLENIDLTEDETDEIIDDVEEAMEETNDGENQEES